MNRYPGPNFRSRPKLTFRYLVPVSRPNALFRADNDQVYIRTAANKDTNAAQASTIRRVTHKKDSILKYRQFFRTVRREHFNRKHNIQIK